MTTTITVTAGHIANGQPENCECCPAVLTIRDTFPGLVHPADRWDWDRAMGRPAEDEAVR